MTRPQQPLGYSLDVPPQQLAPALLVSCFLAAIPMGLGYAAFGKWGAILGYAGGAIFLAPLVAQEGAW